MKYLSGALLMLSPIVACGLMPNSAEVPGSGGCGGSDRYGAVENYKAVRKFAGKGAKLVELSAFHVESDGTLNPNAKYGGGATYIFIRPSVMTAKDELKEKTHKIGTSKKGAAKKEKAPRPYERVRVTIQKSKSYNVQTNGSSTTEKHGGMVRRIERVSAPGNVIPPPQCTFKELWKSAIATGVPADAVAEIRYDSRGYQFTIKEIDVYLAFNTQCQAIEIPAEDGEGGGKGGKGGKKRGSKGKGGKTNDAKKRSH